MYLNINLKKNKTAFILYECLDIYDLLKWGYGKPVAQWVCYIPFGILRGNNEPPSEDVHGSRADGADYITFRVGG